MTTALVVYFLAAHGLAWVLGGSEISYGPRQWIDRNAPFGHFFVDLLECPGCCGAWTGFAASFLPALTLVSPWWFNAPLLAFSTAGLNMLLARAAGLKQ